MSMTKKEKTARLTKIIEMQPPSWLTEETYNEYNEKRQELKANLKPKRALLNMFDDLEYDVVTISPTWSSYSFQYSPRILVELYRDERILSDPTTGQDPKRYSGPNLKTAANHAARHWGWTPQYDDDGDYMKSKSQWIESGTFNLVKYPAGDTVATSLTVGETSPFGDLTSTAAGVAGSLAGTIDTKNDMTITAGGAGTSVTGQFVVGLTLE